MRTTSQRLGVVAASTAVVAGYNVSNPHCRFCGATAAITLNCLVEQFIQIQDIDFDCKKWELLLKQLDYDNLAGIFNIGIYDLIFNRIKSNRSFILSKLETLNIELEINSTAKDVYRNPNLYNGLAGTGLTVINYLR